jgi:hypothetical protein
VSAVGFSTEVWGILLVDPNFKALPLMKKMGKMGNQTREGCQVVKMTVGKEYKLRVEL